jgi:hypothetical protein
MKNIVMYFLASWSLLLVSCKNNATSPPLPGDGFSVKITVKSLLGAPVPGLRISAWNQLSVSPGLHAAGLHHASATSSIRFGVREISRVTLSVLEFDGSPVSTLVNDVLPAGMFMFAWTPAPILKPTRVFRYRLVAQDTSSGSTLFRDSLYAVLWQPDAEISILGWTRSDGSFETTDKLLFPNTLDLPPLVHMNSAGDSLGTFTILNAVTIVLTDTASNRQVSTTRTVNKGVRNDIVLTWNPLLATPLPGRSGPMHERSKGISRESQPSGLFEWKLYQNYPNPFN